MIITKLRTVIKRPPMSVTAQRGMLSKKPQFSTASIISCGKTVCWAEPKPEAFIIVLTSPCAMLNRAIINSSP